MTHTYNPRCHFNPYKAEDDLKLHERGQEAKIRVKMGERLKSKVSHERQAVTLHASHAKITLPTLKWMKP